MIGALQFWVEMAGDGVFPAEINDLMGPEGKQMIIRKFDKNGPAKDKYLQAVGLMNRIAQGTMFAVKLKLAGTWHYAGRGVKFGAAETPILWYQPEGSKTYRVIYGDLRGEDVAAENLPVVP